MDVINFLNVGFRFGNWDVFLIYGDVVVINIEFDIFNGCLV